MTDNQIVSRIQELNRQYNPCNIKVVDGNATCNDGTPCCEGCKHLSKTGCTVSAHACKMWFCDTAWLKFPFAIQAEIHNLILSYEGPLRYRHDGSEWDKNWLAWRDSIIEPRIANWLFKQ